MEVKLGDSPVGSGSKYCRNPISQVNYFIVSLEIVYGLYSLILEVKRSN